jgi:hypothetical protein
LRLAVLAVLAARFFGFGCRPVPLAFFAFFTFDRLVTAFALRFEIDFLAAMTNSPGFGTG